MKILIVDDEVDLVEIVTFFVEEKFPSNLTVEAAYGGLEAIEKLKSNDFDLIICDHNMPKGRGSDVFKYIEANKLKVRFVLCSSTLPSDLITEYGDGLIYGNIIKPDIEIGIEKISKKILSEEKVVSQDAVHLSEYIPLMVNLLYIIGKLPCDLYVNLSDQKYVKCLNKNELFTKIDRDKYLERKISKLYALRGADESELLKIVNESLAKSIDCKQKSTEDRMIEIHTQLTSLLKIYGISDELVSLSKNSIQNTVVGLLKNEKIYIFWEKIDLFGEYPSKLFTLQSILCGIITKKLSWCTESTLEKLVMASFFQDLTLDSIKLMMIIDYSDFLLQKDSLSSKEIDNYLNHPFRAKDIMLKVKDLPIDVDKIVLEQHEMPNGEGFPRKLTFNNIGPLSAMFILSGIVAKYILREEEKLNAKLLFDTLEMTGHGKGKFKEVFICLKALFIKA
jgi:response regulator RpfG family c-di-GMP phosphodiesterase